MRVKIKKLHPNAVIPKYAKVGDAGMDLTAVKSWIDDTGNICYDSGLSFEIPEGYVGLLFPRSSIAIQSIALTNSVGLIDSNYRGSVMAKFKPTLLADNGEHTKGINKSIPYAKTYDVGERFVQLLILPYPKIEFEEVDELSTTDRGAGGYGSTGK